MAGFFENIAQITISIVLALGIVDGIKKLVLALFEEVIEKRQFNTKEKRAAKEDLLNFISLGASTFYQDYPPSKDTAHVYKIVYKVQCFDQKLANRLSHFVWGWGFYRYLKLDKMMRDLARKQLEDLESLRQELVIEINKKLR